MTETPSESPLQFPCEFPIKAFGLDGGDFARLVADIARRHAPGLQDSAVVSRPSKGGKYLAVTVLVQAESKAQLDAIYRDLGACPEVVMAL